MLETTDFNQIEPLIINDILELRYGHKVGLQFTDDKIKLFLHSTTLTDYPVDFQADEKTNSIVLRFIKESV